MDTDLRHGCGIIGTPLDCPAKDDFKLSGPNKLAPTPAVYATLKRRSVIRKERSLLDCANQFSHHDNLYNQRRRVRPSQVDEIMDREDRAYLRAKKTINKRVAGITEGNYSSTDSRLSFLALSVDLPEITPKQARSSIGSRELQYVYALRAEEARRADAKRRQFSDYKASQLLLHQFHKDWKVGLGYNPTQTEDGNLYSSPVTRTYDRAVSIKSLDRINAEVYVSHESDEDELGSLANAGYKNLDAVAKRMSQKLEEDRKTSVCIKRPLKRKLGNAYGADPQRLTFRYFTVSQHLKKEETKWTNFIVPDCFAANSTHSFRADPLGTWLEQLPSSLQVEYNMLLNANGKVLDKETNKIKASIARAKEEQDSERCKIRGLVIKDMGTRFVPPRVQLKHGTPALTDSDRELKAPRFDVGLRHPNLGENSRTVQDWKPEVLLCRRLGIPKLKTLEMSPQEGRKTLPFNPRSYHQEEGFHLHAVTIANGQRFDIPGDYGLSLDEDVVSNVEDETEADYSGNRKRPSQELVKAIFAVEPLVGMSNISHIAKPSKAGILDRGSHSE